MRKKMKELRERLREIDRELHREFEAHKPSTTGVALKRSVEKWEFMVELLDMVEDNLGIDSCALCHEFWTDGGCSGCPICEDTGGDYCRGSPYVPFEDSINETTRRAKRMLEYVEYLQETSD